MLAQRYRIALGVLGGLLPLTSLAGLVAINGTPTQSSIPTAYTSQCVAPLYYYSIYEGQSFRIYDTQTPTTMAGAEDSAGTREMLSDTNVRIYNPYGSLYTAPNGQILNGLLAPFFYKSNGRPGTSHFNFGGISTILVYKQADPTFAIVPNPTPTRTTLAAQVVHNLYRRQVETWNGPLNTSYTMTYTGLNIAGGSFTYVNPSQRYPVVSDYECQNFYIAKCGDGVKDNPNKPGTATTDGKDGILVNGTIIPWTLATKPSEECDGTDGVPAGSICDASCKLQAIPKPTCTLNVQPASVAPNAAATVNRTITGTPTNSPQITANTTTIGGLPIAATTPVGSSQIVPLTPGSYSLSLTVSNAGGSSTCTAPLTVVAPPLVCTITVSPSSVLPGNTANVTWNVTGGNFFATTLYATPLPLGPRPYPVGANQYAGTAFAQLPPNASGVYTFNMTVHNSYATAHCTGTLTTQLPPPPMCTLSVQPSSVIMNTPATVHRAVVGTPTNTPQITANSPTIGGLPFTLPGLLGSSQVIPSVPGAFMLSLTVSNAGGTNTCTAPLTVVTTPPPVLHIHKILLNNIPYHVGDQVGFRIDFSNTGTGTAHHVVLEDYLPVSLRYISSQLVGVLPPYTFGTGMVISNIDAEFSGFDLAPGQSGYMIITGQLISYALCNQTLNTSFISADEIQPPLHDEALFGCYTPTTQLSIQKTVNNSVFFPGQNIQFTVVVTNNGPDVPSSVQVGDLWPNTSCIIPSTSYASSLPLSVTSASNPYLWTLTTPLAVGQSVTLNLSGTVANNPSCAGSYLNTGTLSYVINGEKRNGQSVVPFAVVNTPNISFVKSVLQAGSTHGDSITFALDYANNSDTPVNSFTIVDYRPSTLSFVSSSPMITNQVGTAGGSLLNRNITTPLLAHGTGRILVTGKIQ